MGPGDEGPPLQPLAQAKAQFEKGVVDFQKRLASQYEVVRNKGVEFVIAHELKSHADSGKRRKPSIPCTAGTYPIAKVPASGSEGGTRPVRRVVSEASMDSTATAIEPAGAGTSEDVDSARPRAYSFDAQSFTLSGLETPTVEELASKLADSSKRALEHAQNSLEQAHQNWSSLVQPVRGAVSSATPSPWQGSRLQFRVPGHPDLETTFQLPQLPSSHQFGALWDAAETRIGPFQIQSARRKSLRAVKDPSDLREAGRHVTIVTTAALPWMTGTAINPLLRAHFLASPSAQRAVTLFVPWLSLPDQKVVYPNQLTFESPEEQESYFRNWIEQRTGKSSRNFKVAFYPGRYAPEKGSILPVGDITQYIPDHEADVAVLEEPEHLNWYHHGRRWTDKFNHVVGVMHTNYLDYARREECGNVKAQILRLINSWVCRVHCHKVIKLSDAVQQLPRQCTHFVHGVSPKFLDVGRNMATAMRERACALEHAARVAGERRAAAAPPPPDVPNPWTNGAYFLGKVVWAKGYTELLDLLEHHKRVNGLEFPVDVYGTGDDAEAVKERATAAALPLTFHGAQDHADASLQGFKVFVNPSLSDVVATTTAEALAMGKFVVCAEHPCNAFFSTFQNCLIYRNADEFAEKLQHALSHEPVPMTGAELARLSWEDATSRFLDAVQLAPSERANALERAFDNLAHSAHNTLTGVEAFRVNVGAGANTLATPQRVTDYVATDTDFGGLFDNRQRAQRVYKK